MTTVTLSFSDFEYVLDEEYDEELYPFCTLLVQGRKSKLRDFEVDTAVRYTWAKSLSLTAAFDSTGHLCDEFCVIQLHSNKANTRKGGLFMGDVELSVVTLLSGPEKQVCRILHGDCPGQLSFRCRAEEVRKSVMQVTELQVSDFPNAADSLILVISLVSDKASTVTVDVPVPAPSETESWSLDMRNPIVVSASVSSEDLWSHNCLLKITMAKKMGGYFGSKVELGESITDLQGVFEYQKSDYEIATALLGLGPWRDKQFSMTFHLTLTNLPIFQQTPSGVHYFNGKVSRFDECTKMPRVFPFDKNLQRYSDIYCGQRPVERDISLDFNVNFDTIQLFGLPASQHFSLQFATNINYNWTTLGKFEVVPGDRCHYIKSINLPTMSTVKPYNLSRRFLSFELYQEQRRISDVWITLHDLFSGPSLFQHSQFIDYPQYKLQYVRSVSCQSLALISLTSVSVSTSKDTEAYSFHTHSLLTLRLRLSYGEESIVAPLGSPGPFPPIFFSYDTTSFSLYSIKLSVALLDEQDMEVGTNSFYLRDFFPLSSTASSNTYDGVFIDGIVYQITLGISQMVSKSSSDYFDYCTFTDGLLRDNALYLPKGYTVEKRAFSNIQEPLCEQFIGAPKAPLFSSTALSYSSLSGKVGGKLLVRNSTVSLPEVVYLDLHQRSLYIRREKGGELIREVFYSMLKATACNSILLLCTPVIQLVGLTKKASLFKKRIDQIIEFNQGVQDFEIRLRK